MVVAKQLIKCPYCLEPIAAGATRCKHCQADLGSRKKNRLSLKKLDNFRTGFLAGVLFSIILAFLTWFQFWGGE